MLSKGNGSIRRGDFSAQTPFRRMTFRRTDFSSQVFSAHRLFVAQTFRRIVNYRMTLYRTFRRKLYFIVLITVVVNNIFRIVKMVMEYVVSSRGQNQLVYKGFIHRKERISGPKLIWKCADYYCWRRCC